MRELKHVYEVRPRRDKRGVDLISDALPFGRLWYGEPNAISNAIGYGKFRSRSHDAVISVYDEAGNVIETHQMFREAGLINIQVTPLIHAYPLGNGRRKILCDLLESVRDPLVMQGLLTDVEYKEELSQLRRHLADAGTLVIPHLFPQVWGRKPE